MVVLFCRIFGRLLFMICIEFVFLSVFSRTVLFVSISQVIYCEDRLRNDLYCVEWGVKLYSNSNHADVGHPATVVLAVVDRVHDFPVAIKRVHDSLTNRLECRSHVPCALLRCTGNVLPAQRIV